MESSKQPPGDPARDVANSIAIVLALFLVPFLVLITVMKAFECFPKKVKTLKTIAIESVLKPESKQKKTFPGLKKINKSCVLLKLLRYFRNVSTLITLFSFFEKHKSISFLLVN